MELIITILFFSLASGVCVQLFVQTHLTGQKTKELNFAVSKAQEFAELMRGTDGSLRGMTGIYPDAVVGGDDFFEVFYDSDFNLCSEKEAAYVSDITVNENGALRNIEIRIVKLDGYEEIYSLNATKYKKDPVG